MVIGIVSVNGVMECLCKLGSNRMNVGDMVVEETEIWVKWVI